MPDEGRQWSPGLGKTRIPWGAIAKIEIGASGTVGDAEDYRHAHTTETDGAALAAMLLGDPPDLDLGDGSPRDPGLAQPGRPLQALVGHHL